jgi:hypothetical protein
MAGCNKQKLLKLIVVQEEGSEFHQFLLILY